MVQGNQSLFHQTSLWPTRDPNLTDHINQKAIGTYVTDQSTLAEIDMLLGGWLAIPTGVPAAKFCRILMTVIAYHQVMTWI